jgi:hypothetical protein
MFVAAVFCVTAADERLNLIKRTHFDNLPALHCMQSAHGVNHREESRARSDVLRGKRTCAQRQNRGWTWENKLSPSNFIVPAAFSDCFVTHSRNFELQTKVNHALSPICWSRASRKREMLYRIMVLSQPGVRARRTSCFFLYKFTIHRKCHHLNNLD